MEMTLALVGPGGDARLSFTDRHIRLNWSDTTTRERKMIAKLIKAARKEKMSVVTTNEDGKPDKPANWKDLPGMFGKGKGEVLLHGEKESIKRIATALVDEEILAKNVVAVAQPNGEWKVTKEVGSVVPSEEKKTEVTATKLTGGG